MHGHSDGSLVLWLDFVTCASSVLCFERVWRACVGTDFVRLLSLMSFLCVCAVAAVVASLDSVERRQSRVP